MSGFDRLTRFRCIKDGIDPELYSQGSVFGLNPKITEEMEEQADIRRSMEDCAAAQQAVAARLNPDAAQTVAQRVSRCLAKKLCATGWAMQSSDSVEAHMRNDAKGARRGGE